MATDFDLRIIGIWVGNRSSLPNGQGKPDTIVILILIIVVFQYIDSPVMEEVVRTTYPLVTGLASPQVVEVGATLHGSPVKRRGFGVGVLLEPRVAVVGVDVGAGYNAKPHDAAISIISTVAVPHRCRSLRFESR